MQENLENNLWKRLMEFKTRITFIRPNINGIKRVGNAHIKDAAELNVEMMKKSIDKKKDIISGGNFAEIKKSTKYLRDWKREAGMISGAKASEDHPLKDTGNLYKSLKAKKGAKPGSYGAEMNSYGEHHLEPRTVTSNSFSDKFNLTGKPVPRRRFFGTPKAFFRRSEYRKLLRKFDKQFRKVLNIKVVDYK